RTGQKARIEADRPEGGRGDLSRVYGCVDVRLRNTRQEQENRQLDVVVVEPAVILERRRPDWIVDHAGLRQHDDVRRAAVLERTRDSREAGVARGQAIAPQDELRF